MRNSLDFKNITLALLLALSFAAFLFFSEPAAIGIAQGISVCIETVIPSLFALMMLTSLLASSPAAHYLSLPLYPLTRFLLGLPPSLGCTVLLSMIGGYPVGAKAINQLYNNHQINSKQASLMLCYCCNSSPAFVISGIGVGMLGNQSAGIVIFIAGILSSLLIGFFLSFRLRGCNPSPPPLKPYSFASSIVQGMSNTVSSMLVMCGFVLFFSAVVSILQTINLPSLLAQIPFLSYPAAQTLSCFLFGLLEVTNGCIISSQLSSFTQTVLVPFLSAFSGLSVIFQIISMFNDRSLSFKPFILSRLAHGILCAALSYPFLRNMSLTRTAFHSDAVPVPVANHNTPFLILCILGMFCILSLCLSRHSLNRNS